MCDYSHLPAMQRHSINCGALRSPHLNSCTHTSVSQLEPELYVASHSSHCVLLSAAEAAWHAPDRSSVSDEQHNESRADSSCSTHLQQIGQYRTNSHQMQHHRNAHWEILPVHLLCQWCRIYWGQLWRICWLTSVSFVSPEDKS